MVVHSPQVLTRKERATTTSLNTYCCNYRSSSKGSRRRRSISSVGNFLWHCFPDLQTAAVSGKKSLHSTQASVLAVTRKQPYTTPLHPLNGHKYSVLGEINTVRFYNFSPETPRVDYRHLKQLNILK